MAAVGGKGSGEGFGGYGPAKGMPAGMPARPAPYGSADIETNEEGLPLRPGKEQCLVYLNTGVCQNGLACIFDHTKGAKGMQKANFTGMRPMPGLPPMNTAASPMMPATDDIDGVKIDKRKDEGPMAPTVKSAPPTKRESGDFSSREEKEPAAPEKEREPPIEYNADGLPLRPGAQKCGFYLRSGQCNYGPSCRFDHPEGLAGMLAGPGGFGVCPLAVGGANTNEAGLARRPGRDQCPFLAKTGTCPFGAECRFDHTAAPNTELPKSTSRTAPAPNSKKDCGLGGRRGRRPPPSGPPRSGSFNGFGGFEKSFGR